MNVAWWAAMAMASESETAPPAEGAPTEAEREADLFGAPPTEAPAVDGLPPEAPTSEAAGLPFGEAPASDAIERALSAADGRLAWGGRVWWRLSTTVPETGDGPEDLALDAPGLIDLFADARPNDVVRAYVRGRVTHDFTLSEGDIDPFTLEPVQPTQVGLDQAWLKFNVGPRAFVTAGRQRLQWGVGRFWNPTDFVNQAVLDPLAVDDLRVGVDALKLHVPAGKANFIAVGMLGSAADVSEVGAAVRSEVVFGRTEWTTSLAARKGLPYRAGMDISSGVSVLDLRVEGALTSGPDVHGWEGTFDLAEAKFPSEVDRAWWPVPQVTAALETTFATGDEDRVTVGVEGFYNGLGTSDPGLYPWLIAVGEFTPFYLGEWYAGAYAVLPCPGRCDDSTFTVSAVSNLSDQTAIARFDARGTVLTWLALDGWVMGHVGPAGGEFRFAIDVPPVVGVEGLEEGVQIDAPLVSAGVGAQVRF